jgi:alpha-L-rhamnosidase
VKISHLKTNHIVNPLGFAIEKPRFSWIVEDTPDTLQTAAQFQLSRDPEFKDIVFDTGKVEGQGIDSIAYSPRIDLSPRTRYFWKVRVWGESENAESDLAWFETAKQDEAWQAVWISPGWGDNHKHPMLYHSFELPSKAISARAYISGLGLYHLDLNGQKVGDELFTPYCNAYDQWIQYQTFDITDNLKPGSNRISVMLGNGWYKGRYGADRGVLGFYGNRFALICELHISLENGDTVIINSDTTWKAQASPVIESDIFDGEVYDARISKLPALEQSVGVRTIHIETNRLEARRSLPVRIMEELKPLALIKTPTGETVLDMGQNMTGWLRFKTSAASGTRIHLQFGEVLQNGNFFRENLRTAKAEYTYIADGRDALVEPCFTFFGFRYVKVSAWLGEINLDDFTACVIYSEMDIIGELETSNDKVNRLIQNAFWSQKGNFLDIPTDCPQRDERLGWTGDLQVFSGTASFNMDVAAFLSKYAYDLALEQSKLNGMVPHIVPMVNLEKGGSSAWADLATILPWNLYEFYGDIDILNQQFESMCAWVDYIKRIDDSSGAKRLWTEGLHFGDWLSLDAPVHADPRRGGTPHDFIASAFYCYSSGLVAKAARVLNKQLTAETYERLSLEVKNAIQKAYFSPTGRLAVPTQTGYVLALFMDLVSDEHREQLAEDFIRQIRKDNVHLQTGFVGTPYLCRVLSNIGANELAYQLLLNEDYPSWLYAVNLDATTIWERWNSLNPDGSISSTGMNSFNHYAYGSILEWIYRDVCGLNPSASEDGAKGFRHARIAPKPHPLLHSARARYRSAAGYYETAWQIDESGHLHLKIAIPFNATAEIVLPDTVISEVILNNHRLSRGSQIGQNVRFNLGAGTYSIEYPMTKNIQSHA